MKIENILILPLEYVRLSHRISFFILYAKQSFTINLHIYTDLESYNNIHLGSLLVFYIKETIIQTTIINQSLNCISSLFI